MTGRKKLIEVALPLEAINRACKPETENPFLKNHPRALHVWWARTPLVACRALLFASIVDDPSSRPEEFPTEEAQKAERERLFRILEELVKWENSNNERVLEAAHEEIRKATGGNSPAVVDPFCGRGSIPLEAQRLGLEAYASDLNPVAVLITKALIEIPPRFAGRPPVNPEARRKLGSEHGWTGAKGLAEDVRYYGRWMRERAEERIGHLYPKARLPREQGGGEATVIAWLWARTVRCPNPVCGAQMPLVRSFWLSTKPKKKAWVEPIVDRAAKMVRFEVRTGDGAPPEGTKERGKNRCLVCGQSNITDAQLREQARRFGIGAQLLAVVAEGSRARVYLAPVQDQVPEVEAPETPWLEQPLPDNARWFSPPQYGLTTYRDLFTARQLVALTTFSDLVAEAREQALADAIAAGLPDDGRRLEEGGTGAPAYADAVATYLAFAISRIVDYANGLATWNASNENVRNLFQRQAVPMVWDFAEANVLGPDLSLDVSASWVAGALHGVPKGPTGSAAQLDARSAVPRAPSALVCTDPPYYDNIGYADLSDFFYIWDRRALQSVWPTICSTLLTPKTEELIASRYRFGGDSEIADQHFEQGFQRAVDNIRMVADTLFPVTVFYAYKQGEVDDGSGDWGSTGWEKMLSGLIRAGMQVTGTWPMRTTKSARAVARDTNALASAVVLVCRPRPMDAPIATRQEFLRALRAELPDALHKLQQGSIAPVDLAQAAIGPGMAVFSRYAKVVEADGSPMRVGTALGIINQVLAEVLAEQEEEYDPHTRWAVAWFEQHGMGEGKYGDAEVLSKAKDTAIDAMVRDGFLRAKAGKVALVPRSELPEDWDPATDPRLTVWEITQHLIRRLETGGERAAADLLRRVGALGDVARDLAYRLYVICERKGWAQEALAYNALVVSWPEIAGLAAGEADRPQPTLLEE